MELLKEILLGKILLEKGGITREQLEEGVTLQSRTDTYRSLGDILVSRGHLSSEQLRDALKLQEERMGERDPGREEIRREVLFGKLLISRKLASPQRVYECLREQAALEAQGKKPLLGELLVAKGYLAAEEIRSVLRFQHLQAMTCPGCARPFNIRLAVPAADGDPACPHCGRRCPSHPTGSSPRVKRKS